MSEKRFRDALPKNRRHIGVMLDLWMDHTSSSNCFCCFFSRVIQIYIYIYYLISWWFLRYSSFFTRSLENLTQI